MSGIMFISVKSRLRGSVRIMVSAACLSSRAMAPWSVYRRGPGFHQPPLKFRTVSFPQYGFKVALKRDFSGSLPRCAFAPAFAHGISVIVLSPSLGTACAGVSSLIGNPSHLPFSHEPRHPTGPLLCMGYTFPCVIATTARSAGLDIPSDFPFRLYEQPFSFVENLLCFGSLTIPLVPSPIRRSKAGTIRYMSQPRWPSPMVEGLGCSIPTTYFAWGEDFGAAVFISYGPRFCLPS